MEGNGRKMDRKKRRNKDEEIGKSRIKIRNECY